MMPPIALLPPDLVNQIAAGEVLERPSSAVKELLENSLDAGATRIDIELEEGGRELIRIVDDGCGIPREQLALAVASHATSKISSVSDLFHVRSLGFRGEALASIAGVSELTIRSRPPTQEVGAEIIVRHGMVGTVRDCAAPVGTQIEVRDLFGSVPVRKKFLRSKSTELGHAVESATRLALAFPGTSISVRHHQRTILERPGGLSPRESIGVLLGSDVADALLPIAAEAGPTRVEGFACHPNVDRPNNRGQYFFVNNRWFRDRSLSHALQEAYRGLIMTGRYPLAIIFIHTPAEDVDVNVHPQKHEVRFVDPHRIFSLILGAVRSRFLSADLTGHWNASPKPNWTPHGSSAVNPVKTESLPIPDAEWEPGGTSSLWPKQVEYDSPAPRLVPTMPSTPRDNASIAEDAPATPPLVRNETNHQATQAHIRNEPSRVFQLHNSYIVVETEEGMLLVDQHALHERILYEELKSRITKGSLEAQELLVPEIVELTQVEIGLLVEHKELLSSLGLSIDEFGEKSIAVRRQPVLLHGMPVLELLRIIANQLDTSGSMPETASLLDRILSTAACKAAIKAGDPLTPSEMSALLARKQFVEDSHHCPHGRPTVLRFTLKELERQFKRV